MDVPLHGWEPQQVFQPAELEDKQPLNTGTPLAAQEVDPARNKGGSSLETLLFKVTFAQEHTLAVPVLLIEGS